MKNVLIVGINSYIGSNLKKYLLKKKISVIGTTHKKADVQNNIYYLNLKRPKLNFLNIKIDAAIVCASITNVQICELAPNKTKKINVINTIKLLKYLNSHSIFNLYISSNLVFNGKKPFNSAKDKPKPVSKYGKYKLQVEKFINSKKSKNYSVLRLTKVVSNDSKFIRYLRSKINKRKILNYESDYFLSPIKIDRVCSVIYKILKKKHNGLFQLGGKKEYNLDKFVHYYFSKKNILTKNQNKTKIKWKNYHNSLKTFLPF